MSTNNPSVISRFFLAFVAFFRALGSGDFARTVRDYPALAAGSGAEPAQNPPAETPEKEPQKPEPPKMERAKADSALQLLALFQREGRFLDFLFEEVDAFSDADIGAAARVVHQGCLKALKDHATIVPVREEEEDSTVTLEAVDASLLRLTGNVTEDTPVTGTMVHRGWRAERINLPKLAEAHDVTVLARAEVEIP